MNGRRSIGRRELGHIELAGVVQRMPPAFAPGAARGVLGDEAMLGELAQVPADVAAVLPENHSQRTLRKSADCGRMRAEAEGPDR
jgi:hypothetical protein